MSKPINLRWAVRTRGRHAAWRANFVCEVLRRPSAAGHAGGGSNLAKM